MRESAQRQQKLPFQNKQKKKKKRERKTKRTQRNQLRPTKKKKLKKRRLAPFLFLSRCQAVTKKKSGEVYAMQKLGKKKKKTTTDSCGVKAE